MLLPCSSSTCHGFSSAYIIAHSLTLLFKKLSWGHITLFLHRSPNPFPYCTSLSPFSLLIPLLLFFMILLSSRSPHFPSQVLLPSPQDHLLPFYFYLSWLFLCLHYSTLFYSIGYKAVLGPRHSVFAQVP